MRRTRRRQRRSKRFAWSLAVIGAVLLVVTGFLWASLDDGSQGGTPQITVDQQRIDYGDVKLDNGRSFAIRVTNTGSGVLRFRQGPSIEVLEGC